MHQFRLRLKRVPQPIQKLAVILLYFGIWGIASALTANELLLPGPVQTVSRLCVLISGRANRLSLLATVGRVAMGLAMGTVLGLLLGILTAFLPFAEVILKPLRNIIRATPVTSFILLFILWFSSDAVPVFIAALMTLPIIWVNVSDGLNAVDGELKEMARAYRLPLRQRVRDLYVPSVMPRFMGALKNALGFAWKSGVAAEILAIPRAAVGSLLYRAKLNIDTTDLFAWTLGILIMSAVTEYALMALVARRKKHD